ncbi:hypothetical protein INR49_009873, partial [Caranx melampygus]
MSTSIKHERTICVLLPNKDQLDITVSPKSTGQDVFNRVTEFLGIKELHFFGLTVALQKRALPLVFFLKVQYYIENGRLLCERKSRHLYYSDMRERVLRSECRQQEEVYFQLAGYALQADLGDHPPPRKCTHITPYFEPKDYFPPKRGMNYLLCHGPKVHQELWGLSTRDAILLFIREACRLEDVPVIFYRLQKDKKEERGTALLGLTLRGMQVYQEVNNIRQLLYDFPWSNVGRLTFLGKKFEIQPDGLPSARKLVYYTGSSFRSRHLLLHLSSSHRLYLSLQPALKHLRQLEESEGREKCYRESYISDDLDLDPPGSESSPGLSRHSTSSSGIEADARQHSISTEMASMDEEGQRQGEKCFSSAASRGSSGTSGFDAGSKARIEDEAGKAVLTSSPDYDALFESLSWPSELLPGRSRITAEAGDDARCRETTAAACRLVSVCVPLCDETVPGRLALSILPSLQLSEEVSGPGRLSVEVASEVMAALIPSLSADEHLTLSTLSSALSCIKTLADVLVSKITVRLLLTLLNCCSGARLESLLKLILEDLCSWHCTEPTPVVTERVLLCLTPMSDHLLNPAHSLPPSCDPRLSFQFWRMVQDGLIHRDSVSRKRALYLLKRCVALSEAQQVDCPLCPSGEGETLFKWAHSERKVLREFWEDYALVMETLEENQIHVVRPVLNRIDTLIQTTVNDSQASGEGLLHPSWLLCVYQRMFHSENKSLMREGVCHLLELQVLQQPAFALAFSQFIVGLSWMFCLKLHSSTDRLDRVWETVLSWGLNFKSSWLPSSAACRQSTEALSKLPPAPVLGTDGLTALREVLRCTMITHQVLLRGAAQCFLLNSALCLTDVSAVTLDDLFSFLMHFRADESLCRGTQIWNQLCTWLSDNECSFKPRIRDGDSTGAAPKKETVRSYVQAEIHNFLRVPASTGQTERLPDCKEADKLARAILLCVDMEKDQPGTEISETLESLFAPLLETLSRVNTNIYLPVRKSDKSLQLMLRLFQLGRTPSAPCDGEGKGDRVMVAMEKLIFKVIDPIQEFILRRLCGELQELFDVERAELYQAVLRQIVVMYSFTPQRLGQIKQNGFLKLIRHSVKVLQEPSQQAPSVADQVSRAVAMASLATVCGLLEQEEVDMQSETLPSLKELNDYFYTSLSSSSQSPLGNFNKRLLKPQTGDCTSDLAVLLQDWGRIAANFMRDQWICLSFLIKAVGIPESCCAPDALRAALSCSVEALALLPSDLVLPLLTFMETVLPQVLLDEEELCVEAVTLSWELVQGLSTNAHDFWPALKGFISMAFHHKLLELTHSRALTLMATLKQTATELIELSQSKSGVFGVLLQHCCQTWLPSGRGCGDQADTVFISVFSYINILTEACVYGPVFRRDQRLTQDVQTYLEQLREDSSSSVIVTSDNRDEQLPRTCVLGFLSCLDPSKPHHERLIEELVLALLKKDNEISRSKVRYYSNSLQHRVKNRVWQTLLLLLPKLKEEFVATILTRVFEAGFCSNQASVKYLIEWMMILILIHHPQHMDSFWSCFSMDHEKTKTSVCTFLSVLVHLNIIVPNLKDKAAQLRKALDIILQWCFNHNFSVRLYALLALKRVWSLAEIQAEEGADGFGGLSTVIEACLNQAEAMQSTGNANKNWIRIQEHFFFGAFHPIRDYSVETIFYTFPSLSELADDEWLPPWKFEKLSCFSDSPSFPLKNPAPDLSQLQPGDWIQQDKGEQDKEERWAEVQKKITPWKLGIQEQEPELQLVPAQRAARVGKMHGALLVVASLIDKPTNLGGLCRTCEIFGASALVLDSLRHISDKHFQSLSVSSELWLPLLEVKPVELADFLQVKKGEGYCIVGVEQTANSQSLQEYQFPEKTLLLLGNEREGIPANLLQMLDVCVEIPQQGVIRSLNVHVSAALLIWEYTRQHLSPGSAELVQHDGVAAVKADMEDLGRSWLDPGSPPPEPAAAVNASWTGRAGLGLSRRTQLVLEVLMVLMCLGAVADDNSGLESNLSALCVIVCDLCLYVGYTSSVYCTASVLTLAAIALDRYHSIMDCLRYSSRCTLWRTCAVVLWIWLQALVTSCPPLLGWSSVSYVVPMYSCAVNWASSPSYTAFMAALCYLFPAVVILFCYVNIVKVARSHARRIHTLEDSVQRSRNPSSASASASGDPPPKHCATLHSPSRLIYHVSGQFVPEVSGEGGSDVSSAPPNSLTEQSNPTSRRLFSFLAQSTSQPTLQNSQQHQSHHGVVRLFLVISAFFLCWTPYIGVALVQATEIAISGQSSLVPPFAVTFSYWLVLLNSDINPLLYALLSKRFQGALQGLRQKIRAHLGSVVGGGSEVRVEGDEGKNSDPCTLNTAHPGPPSSSESSTCDDSKTDAGADRRVNCLQVPSRPQEGSRLPFSALTKERQATFFYGQITVQ